MRCPVWLATILLLILSGKIHLIALERNDLLFYVSFDRTLKADFARGIPEPINPPEARFVQGISGKAIIPSKPLAYSTEGNFRAREGTFAVWVKPLDWRSSDAGNRTVACIPGMMFYKYLTSEVRFYQWRGTLVSNYAAVFEPGRWRLMAGTWKPGELQLYFDGVRLGKVTEGVKPLPEGTAFTLNSGSTAYDELMVFKRALRQPEIEALFLRYKRRRGPEVAN